MLNAAVLLCAGSGSRMAGSVDDKVLVQLGGKPVVLHSFEAFALSGRVQVAVVVYRDPVQKLHLEEILSQAQSRLGTALTLLWAQGGAERQYSVFNALKELATLPAQHLPEYVLIHDCARPMLRSGHVGELLDAAALGGASVLANRVADTLKRTRGTAAEQGGAFTLEDVDRSEMWAMQTPQAFERTLITAAYARVVDSGQRVTDDTSAAALAGHKVVLVENRTPNPKLTTAADLPYLEFLLRQSGC